MSVFQAVVVLCTVVYVHSLAPKSVLIIQNKGGGHGEVGFSLAKNLLKENHKVVILQDTAADMKSQPFCEYSTLTGVEVVSLKLKDIEELNKYLNDKKYDAVIDNNSKDVLQATAITTAVKAYGSSSQYIYISSGGMYKGDMPEGGYMEACCSTKDDNECRMIEKYLESQDMPWTSFRPQYIYGDNTNKRINVDWFVDRIVRERTVPIPGDGSQVVALSHVDDVTAMIALAIGNEKSHKQVFNCGTDRFISYKNLCTAISKACKQVDGPKFAFYDPKKLEKKASFPFRATTFVLDPSKAKTELGWSGAKHKLQTMTRKVKKEEPASGDIQIWIDQYLAMGLQDKVFDSSEDDMIIKSLETAV